MFDDTLRRHPRAPALDDGDTRLDYADLAAEVDGLAERLRAKGVGRGDRVGVRVPSGTIDLYVAILAVLATGAAYVPVDFDDPGERAETVFSESEACAVIGEHRSITMRRPRRRGSSGTARTSGKRRRAGARLESGPGLDDDAWIIFTSGSTGRPKGVAVSHRAAAAFVDAEARLFLPDEPIGPGDRVLAGLSVAFDASCEEMWLAWRHGACLVAAPRSLVRTGMDLGPWLAGRGVTVVSTVPTLAALWPVDILEDVRLLILGGEACPPDVAARLAVPGREVWNTYGPTEATVVSCAAPLTGHGPVRIGRPLDGWDLAVVDEKGAPVAMGETGELVIGGVGLARYLDPGKDAEKYAPLPALGWRRAYRSGDLVRAEPSGLVFVGRADDQVKVGGRRIELGEVDAALQALRGVAAAAAAVRTTGAGHQVLVGYIVPVNGTPAGRGDAEHKGRTEHGFDRGRARRRLSDVLPAALVPRIAIVDSLPTRTSGKVDRSALPWPLPGVAESVQQERPGAQSGTERWVAQCWEEVLGEAPSGPEADFFAAGGTSLGVARLVAALRERYPDIAVDDVYSNPTPRGLAGRLSGLRPPKTAAITPADPSKRSAVVPVPRRTAIAQTVLMVPLLTIGALPWLTIIAAYNNTVPFRWTPDLSWWWVGPGLALFVSSPGRMGMAALGARLLLHRLAPGTYPRGGRVHLRLWAAERLAAVLGAASVPSEPWLTLYARALGAKIGPGVDLHSPPPVTGMLTVGAHAAIEPEADLDGYWLDGDRLHIGGIRIGPGARVGARATLFPGTSVGENAQVAPGSAVMSAVPAGEYWTGVPAARQSEAHPSPHPSPHQERPPRTRRWVMVYGTSAVLLSLLPLVAGLPGLAVLGVFARDAPTAWLELARTLSGVPAATVAAMAAFALVTLVCVRLLSIGLRPGGHPVHSRQAWQAWATVRLTTMARVWLYPLYASVFTPSWLRLLGARVGRDAELSTVVALPAMTSVGDGAFLADDTMVAPYELTGGRLRIAHVRIGRQGFLGNSGMAAPGRDLPEGGLVGVQSVLPRTAKAHSSYLGIPPVELPRTAQATDRRRTYDPPRGLKLARALVELFRLVPAMCTVAVAVLVAAVFEGLAAAYGFVVAALSGGAALLVGGVLAATITTVAKWALVGRVAARSHPLWSSFVWRNELADNFVEVLAVPWFARPWLGTAPLNLWLRSLGSRVGRGVWCETYWLPEPDQVRLGRGSCVNRGCVLQTHLFHDRVLSIDAVELQEGTTLGPNGIVLPATIGAHTTVGPASLVIRGETVPPRTRWLGNPIAAWPSGHTGEVNDHG